MAVLNIIAEQKEELTEWRRDLHAHPELGFEEHRTADFIAAKLEAMGIETHRGMAKTGVIGVIKGQGSSGKMIGLRADMDALPMDEENDFAHASVNEGRMHACGHDGHITMLLGAARYLSETRNFDGTVVLIFQPAEEGGGGGEVMVKEGLFEQFPMDSVWGLHNWPGVEVGRAVVHSGVCMAAADVFHVTLKGKSAHAAMPHLSRDVILAGSALVQAIQAIVARGVDPVDTGVISITQFHSGSAYNVLPDSAHISGSARYIERKTGDYIEEQVRHFVAQIASTYGCEAEVVWEPGYPPTKNHASEASRAAKVAESVLGKASVTSDAPPSMAAEDFSYMLEAKPGAYIWLGAGTDKQTKDLHNSQYDFNDDLLPLGASYWVQLVESELAR